MPYQLDGRKISYEKVLETVLESIYRGYPVYHSYHMGMDLYWVHLTPPHWAHEVELSNKGLISNYRLIEPIKEDKK